MARNSKRSEEEKRRLRAMHAKMRSQAASNAAQSRWQKEYDAYPRHSLEDIAKRQAERTPKARQQDAKNTSRSVIDPRSSRVDLWMRDPVHNDLLGIDTQPAPDRKPVRPGAAGRRPSRPASEESNQAPSQGPTSPRKRVPATEAKKSAKSTIPNAAAPRAQATAKTAPAKPAIVRVPKGIPQPSKKALKTKGFSLEAYIKGHQAWQMAKPRGPGAQPPPLASNDDKLRRLILGPQPRKASKEESKAWSIDVSKGGLLLNRGHTMGLFDPKAPSSRQKVQQRNNVVPVPPWKNDKVVELDLAKYVAHLHPQAKLVPIGHSLYSRPYIEQIMKVMKGPSLVSTTKERGFLVVRQGRRGILLAPVIPDAGTGASSIEHHAVLDAHRTP